MEEDQPKYTRIIVCTAFVIGIIAFALVLHTILWAYAGWTHDAEFFGERFFMTTWGIVIPAIVMVIAIVGAKTHQKSPYLDLIFGIIITILAALSTLVSALRLPSNIGELISPPSAIGFYIGFTLVTTVCLALAIVILVSGIKLITYYSSHNP
ncbi:MAG: hypothetical protein LUQ65_04325 [Candidatus Helarchaeota archaeon]|nr:hypothetical protein [Candidatus Helarchaeota archaeon]